jgi:hypothetical protein
LHPTFVVVVWSKGPRYFLNQSLQKGASWDAPIPSTHWVTSLENSMFGFITNTAKTNENLLAFKLSFSSYFFHYCWNFKAITMVKSSCNSISTFFCIPSFQFECERIFNVMGTLTNTTRNVWSVHQLFLLGENGGEWLEP